MSRSTKQTPSLTTCVLWPCVTVIAVIGKIVVLLSRLPRRAGGEPARVDSSSPSGGGWTGLTAALSLVHEYSEVRRRDSLSNPLWEIYSNLAFTRIDDDPIHGTRTARPVTSPLLSLPRTALVSSDSGKLFDFTLTFPIAAILRVSSMSLRVPITLVITVIFWEDDGDVPQDRHHDGTSLLD